MPVDSPLGSLCKVLRDLRDTASHHEEALKRSEAATRATLVDPLLRALGWDITDVTMVEVEKTKGEFRADYVLLDPHANIKAIIEAKAVGEALTDHRTVVKLFSYAANFHCNSVFITDGRQWHHYTDMNIMDTHPSMTLNINSDDLTDVAAYFVQRVDASWHWKQQPDDTMVQIEQLKSEINRISTELRIIQNQNVAYESTLPDECTQPSAVEHITKTSPGRIMIEELGNITGKSISKFYINGCETPARRWKDLLEGVVTSVLAVNDHFAMPLVDAAGRKTYLLSLTPPKEGRSYTEIKHNTSIVFLYTNYSARETIRNTIYMMQFLPENQRKVEIEVTE